MGYKLSSLGNLPIDGSINFYIFVVSGGWNSEASKLIKNNFDDIAKTIGQDSVIVNGHDDRPWRDEVLKTYFGDSADKLKEVAPALLLTDSHPDDISDQSLRLVIPIHKVQDQFTHMDVFFENMSSFVRGENDDFLQLFADKEAWFEDGDELFELKPNFCGIGINLNEFIKRWKQRKEK